MIEKHLKELLFTNDIVALPGLGCFLTERTSAHISIANNKILPPSKRITFNEKLHVGDGENFVKAIVEVEKMSENEAQDHLFRYAGHVKYKLNTEKQYIIDELGRLYTNKDGSLAFEQFNRFNYLADSFGLPEIFIQPIARNEQNKADILPSKVEIMTQNTTEENNFDSEMESENITQKAKKKSGLGLYYFATSFALVFVLCTTYYLNMDKKTYAIGSFDPISLLKGGNSEAFSDKNVDISENKLLPENSENISEEIASPVSEVEPTNSENITNEKLENITNKSPEIATPSVDLSNAVTSKMGKFYIIVGSFKKSSKAQNYINDLIAKGLDAKMIAENGNTESLRVSAADFDDYNAANAKKMELKNQLGIDAWILNY